MLFGDIRGFSKVKESQGPIFLRQILGMFSKVLERFGDGVLYRNTWGDALYCVFENVAVAADCAVALQEGMRNLDLAALGLPPHLALRLGAHVGPVFRGYNPVIERYVFHGAHVTRTARIEPKTPAGQVYVSEPFAAMLAMDTDHWKCEYVGRMETAKGYGQMRMYLLH